MALPAPERPALRPRGSPELELFRSLLSSHSGIDFGQHREVMLENSLRRRMTEAGARTLYEYYRMVTAPGTGQRELQTLVDDVSVHETSFFRNLAQFRTLENVALPERVSRHLRERKRRMRIWSAGCSTGQEPYSIAMSFHATVVLPSSWDLQITATDISAQVVQIARAGLYTQWQLEGLSAETIQRFFDRKGEHYSVRPWARRGVEFVTANVLDGAPGSDLDVIFCRNLMIYFDKPRQAQLIGRFVEALAPGGYLFLGHTESIAGLSDAFDRVSLGHGIAYRKRT
jgi:chemotaxis protein methyltransferase CheR